MEVSISCQAMRHIYYKVAELSVVAVTPVIIILHKYGAHICTY